MVKNNPQFYSRFFGVALVAAALCIELFVGFTVFRYAQQKDLDSLRTRAATIAATIEINEVASLKGDLSDLDTPEYQSLKAKMVRVKEANEDIRFVYVIGQRNGEIFFYIDNEPAESSDNSPPGQVYYEASPQFHSTFSRSTAFTEGPYADRWGNWITGVAPMVDATSGHTLAAVGIDIGSANHYRQVIITTASAVSLVGSLLLAIFIFYLFYRNAKAVDQAKSEFLSLASHQLRTPASVINWYLELLQDPKKGPLNEKQKGYVLQISHGNDRMIKLIRNLLSVMHIEIGKLTVKPVLVDVRKILDDVIDSQQVHIKAKNHQVAVNQSPTLLPLLVDPDLLSVILENLLSNAVKYTLPNGKITCNITTAGRKLLFQIRDSGIGIPASQQRRIFQKLFRASNAIDQDKEGNGFGLYMVQKTVKALGGRIWFTSEYGKGTAFYVELPVRN